jgi:hypothetical protein
MTTNSLPRLLLLIFVVANATPGQSAPTKKDIPTIAKSSKGAIVTIITAANDKPIAQGTGFLVSADGVIMTNYHVIAKGNVAAVKFADGTTLPVDGVLATDKFHDLAILKIHGNAFPTLTLDNSDQVEVGEEVVAIGNPLGLELTVSNGIISGIRSDERENDKLLQITAPISLGSSGGPLFNMFGKVVGINAMYLEGGESLNFAIPVNDAKRLLQNQSAQPQQLPNEPDTDTAKPNKANSEASTESPSGPESREKNSATSALNTAKHKQPLSYYIRSFQHGTYLIEYNGRQLAAICRENLRWIHGTDNPGSSIGECEYLPHLIGQHIRAELMWRQDKELRYRPWVGLDTQQGADVLGVIAEGPIRSPLRTPSPKTSPDIVKTLHWIQNTLADGAGKTHYSKGDGEIEYRISLLPDVNGCQVTFADAVQNRSPLDEPFRSRSEINLADLDPTSLTVADGLQDNIGPVSLVMVDTTDKAPAVHLTVNARNWQPDIAPSTSLMWELPSPYAARFTKALRQAITLCGGKRSSF